MDHSRIALSSADANAAVNALQSLFGSPFTLPADADTAAALPHSGGIHGQWVSAGGATAGDGVLLYIHGGGFAAGDPVMERLMAYRLSRAAGRPAFGVTYRLAPRHPYPAALEDVLAAYRWVLDRGVPPEKVVLSGESAGGTLVLSALLYLRDAGTPMPAGAIAFSPITDLTLSSPSLSSNDGRDFIDATTLSTLCSQYLKEAPADAAPQSPLFGDPTGLPPLLLGAGTREVLLDDAHRFARAADAAGVQVTLDEYEGLPHSFNSVLLAPEPERLAAARTLHQRASAWIAALG